MIFNTRKTYALRALLDILANGGEASLKGISERQNISNYYLQHIFAQLKKAGIVTSHRGQKGGYTIKKNPTKLTVRQVFEAVDGPLPLDEPKKFDSEEHEDVFELVKQIHKEIENSLDVPLSWYR
jgi:Rrf2 family protein